MKVRKLAVALALAGSMGSSLAYALGLGEVTVNSSLNEPLRAEIDLVRPGDLSREEIAANLAPQRDFERVGIEPMFFLNEIQFNVEKNSRGELVLKLTTRKPVREPYLNFLVEVAWPSGRLLREYALLIDPPTFREGPAEQPAEVAATPTRQQQTQQASPAPSQQAESRTGRTSRTGGDRTYGPVRASDTLWGIAQQIRPSADLTPQQVMLAIQDENPDAFLSNNINLLREGSVLRVPSEQAIRSRTPREAVQQVSSQNRRFQEQGAPADPTPVDAVNRTAKATPAPEAGAQGDELRLVAADSSAAREDGSHGGETGGSGEGQADTRLALAQEQLDKTRRENEELNSRLEDLQSQLADMQRLVQLQSDQMASMQAMSAENNASGTETPAADSAPGDAGATQPAQLGGTQDSEVATSPNSDTAESAGEETVTAADETVADQQPAVAAANGEAGGEENPENGSAAAAVPTETADEQVTAEPVEQPAPAEPVTQAENTPAEPAAAETVQPAVAQADEGLLYKLQNNPVYQVGAGAVALALLGLLWLLARKNARREEEFYAQLQAEEAHASAADGGRNADQADGFAMALGGAAAAGTTDDEDQDQQREAETAALHAGQPEGEDPSAEADVYLAYGRMDQATQVLEGGVAQAPERHDLRLKLLSIYADTGNEEAFARHMGELEASDDENLIAEGEVLRGRLAEQLDSPTIDDLESQLREAGIDTYATEGQSAVADEAEWNAEESTNESFATGNTDQSAVFPAPHSGDSAPETVNSSRDDAIEYDFGDLDLDLDLDSTAEENPDRAEAPVDEDDLTLEEVTRDSGLDDNIVPSPAVTGESEGAQKASEESLDLNEDDFKGIDFSEEPGADTGGPADDEFEEAGAEGSAGGNGPDELDLSDLEADDTAFESGSESKSGPEPMASTEASAFDESFLDELDAELEKVTQDEPGTTEAAQPEANVEDSGTESEASALEDLELDDLELENLELDVSDEDLAFIEEVSGGSESANGNEPPVAESAEEDDSLDFDIGDIGDLGEPEAPEQNNSSEQSRPLAEDIPEATGSAQESDLEGFDDSLLNVDEADLTELSEDDISDEDDFGFLDGADEAATKLDLARAYFEMGDAEGARDILEEVTQEGSDSQKAEAQELLGKLS